MVLDQLPDLALHEICLKLRFKDIGSLKLVNRRLNIYIGTNRLLYSKREVMDMEIVLKNNGKRTINIFMVKKRGMKKKVLDASAYGIFNSLNPSMLISYDHDELANMSRVWWKERREIQLEDIIDYRRYLPHFDRCTSIALISDNPINLSEVLASMETKNLKFLSVAGDGELECTDDDFRKIGRLSNNMLCINLENITDSTNISNDAILDMIEIGSFGHNAKLRILRIQENMKQCLDRRDWVVQCQFRNDSIQISRSNNSTFWIKLGKENFLSARMLPNTRT